MDNEAKRENTKTEAAGGHVPWKMALIIAHVPLFLLAMMVNYLSTSDLPTIPGMYLSNTEAISNKYPTKLTPSGWTFTIWAFIYVWQLVHIVYSLTLLCRKTKNGCCLYVSPGHIHFSFYIVYMINSSINLSWIFLFDCEILEISFVFLFFNSFTAYICGVLICKYLDKAGQSLESSGNITDIWMTRLFTLNGLAFYGTWTTIATQLNFALVLEYRAGVDAVVCAWIALSFLTVQLLAWFVLETFVFDRHLRYCFSPYMVLLVALAGVLTKQYAAAGSAAHMVYALILLSIVAILGVVKVIVMVVRGIRSPISYHSNT